MKYYIIAGEASGDLHAANLMHALKRQDPKAVFRCWGGDLMEQAGGNLVKHYRDLAFMGFTEVVLNLKTILNNISFCKKDILQFQPDILILIDYPGFNLRIADFAHKKKLKVFYYIAPQVWAWHTSRVKKMKQNINELFVILPFEKAFFAKHDWENVHFVGHPLLDAVEKIKTNKISQNTLTFTSKKPIIALLPGSRQQEIKRILPIMLQIVPLFPTYQFVIAGAAALPFSFYENFITAADNVAFLHNQTYDLLQNATAALVASGTATLETALFQVPQIVCYKGGFLSIQIAKRLLKISHISLVNLILDKAAVKELIQEDLNKENLAAELTKILPEGEHFQDIKKDYLVLKKALGNAGASQKTAELMLKFF
ncbi:MAG: lipid-A-disaccharide synthase [Chitinophagales bacterium]